MSEIWKPNITICIPTYNRAHVLPEVIKSVLWQTYKDFDLFISDDASVDNTEEIVKDFNDPRIRYHKNPTNLGLIDNWDFSVRHALGKYVFKLDDDDYIAPTYIEKTVSLLEKYSNIGSVYTGFFISKDYGGKWIREVVDHVTFKGSYINGIDYVKAYLLGTSVAGLHHSSVVFRRSLAEEVGFFKKVKNDDMFSLALASKADVGYVPEPLFYYVQHDNPRASFAENKNKGVYDFNPTKFVQDFYNLDFVQKNAKLNLIKSKVFKKQRVARSVKHLLVSREHYDIKEFSKIALELLKKEKKLILSPLFIIILIVTLLISKNMAENFHYSAKRNTRFSRFLISMFAKKK